MSCKVLVVDDVKTNVKLLTEILEDEGYTVHSAYSGVGLRELVHSLHPDIILLDIMMPGIDGFEVCRQLKKDFELKDIPIIMVTARTDGKDIRQALEMGAFDYIKKPVDEVEVLARVQSALRFKQQQDALKVLAMRDGLTGVYNHSLLLELLDRELAKQERNRKGICFAMLDIDHFKKINDTYGHMAGDLILQELCRILTRELRKSDVVGRYGGEEFGIILPEITEEDAYLLCDRVRRTVEDNHFQLEDRTVRITISIGLCFKSGEEELLTGEMIKRADEALYRAKNHGRNRIEGFVQVMR